MISLTSVAKRFGERTLFENVSLTIGVSERIGLVGPNGAGKSTLLFLLAGHAEPDEGQVSRNRRASVGLLLQEAPATAGRTLLEEMLDGHEELRHLEHRLALVEEEMRQSSDPQQLEVLAAEHGELESRFAAGGGYDLPSAAKKILSGLAFRPSDFDRPASEFSGGWLMRLALGRLLLTEPDLLLLDEPTNYLDLESVIWLEGYLRQYDGSLVIASHDRALLNRLATRTLEIDGGRVTGYAGNYDAYVRARQLREEGLEATRKSQEREIAHTQAFIDRFRYKASKARQVQSRIKRLEKIERVESTSRRRTLRFAFSDPPACGRTILELRQAWQSYGGPPVYAELDLTIERGERIALVGPNGAGKSTLLKLIAGVLTPDRGERRLDPRASLSYFAQRQVEALDHRRSIYDEVAAAAPGLLPEQVRGLLGRFLFSGDDAFKPIGVLSGGEKSRVALAKLLVHPPNLLLLDEPTSHLDIPSRDVLEEALSDYGGALVAISHDRHFLSAIANRVVEVGGGGARSYLGTYDEYLEKKERMAAGGDGAGRPGSAPHLGSVPPRAHRTREDKRREAEARNERNRTLTPKRRERDRLEAEIGEMTARLAVLEAEMANPEFYAESGRFEETFRAYGALKTEIDAKTERWTHVTRELEALERQAAGG